MTTTTEPNWDPPAPDREYFRHQGTGDRGYIVRRDGKTMIRLDRPMQEILKPKNDEWQADEYGSTVLREQVAMVAFAADRAACTLVGLHAESRVGWMELTDKQRNAFTVGGPPKDASPIRVALYLSILAGLKPFTRDAGEGDPYKR